MEFVEENWLLFSIVCGFVAKSIGRSFWKYFFLSFFLSPIIGFIVLLIKGKKTEERYVERYIVVRDEEEEEMPEPDTRTHYTVPVREVKFCGACGKRVASDAKYCPNCGNEL